MLYYIYDGSFDGILTAIYETYYRKESPEKIIFKENYQENILIDKVYIDTDEEKANKVYQSIRNKISNNALKYIFYVFLSEVEEAGTYIYNYLKLGWRMGGRVDLHLSDDRVLNVHKIHQRVNRERHLLLGLLRFRKLEGDIYYAPFEPEFNTVGLLANHFVKRFSEEKWIIHDVKRGIGVFFNGEEWIIREIGSNDQVVLSNEEKTYQELWKAYYNSIAIKNRIRPKLQRRCMPMKYWRFLIEKDEG